MPTAPAKPAGRNPFDTAQKPGKSLFERIEAPKARTRSESWSTETGRYDETAPQKVSIDMSPGSALDRLRHVVLVTIGEW
jgi:hypothetical protein